MTMFAFHPMALLLKHEGYPPAVLAAILIHGLLLYIILDNPFLRNDMVDLDTPVYISATTAEETPQRLRRLQQIQQEQAREAAAQRQREQEAAAQAAREEEARRQAELQEQQRLEQQRSEQELAQRRQAEQEAQREAQRQAQIEEQQRLERQRQEQLAREQQAAQQAEAERQQQLAAQREADARAVDTYSAIVHNTVTRNWVIPPSARNGMTAVLAIRLVPTGEVISVEIIQSSGDAAFDRSVEQAVRRAARFPELQGMSTSLFEASFRNLTLTFRPEDLLR